VRAAPPSWGRHPKTFTEADIATALSERQRSPGHHVDGGSSPDIVSTPSGQIRNLLVEYGVVPCTHRDGVSVLALAGDNHEIVVKLRRALSYRYPVNRIAV
jgi:hypothetical protein